MSPLAARVLGGARRDRLFGPSDRVLVALSGGPDSVALTFLLREVLPEIGAALAGVVHLNHGLRGSEADRDEVFCRDLAERLALPCLVEKADAGAFAAEHRVSLEVAGHRLRHELYARARRLLDASLVATGHTQNDLAETFLMRALRGAGLRGLGGIRPLRKGIVRPLLSVSRPEIIGYLSAMGQPFCEDSSNRDAGISRNRIRLGMVPWLEDHVSPGAVEALARTARLVAADADFLSEAATRAGADAVLTTGDEAVLDGGKLMDVPLALRRRVVLRALEDVSQRSVTAKAVERVLDLLEAASPPTIQLCGVLVTRDDHRICMRRAAAGHRDRRKTSRLAGSVAGVLTIPGALELPEGGSIRAARIERADAAGTSAEDTEIAVLDASHVLEPLRVRYRRPGDRLQPLGMAGHKKLQDLLVDRKVPREARDRVPLVVDATDQIVWVGGHVIADGARVTSATTSVLLLQYRR